MPLTPDHKLQALAYDIEGAGKRCSESDPITYMGKACLRQSSSAHRSDASEICHLFVEHGLFHQISVLL